MITFEADAMCGTTTAFFSSASPGFMKGSSCGGFGEPSSSEQSSFDFFFFFFCKKIRILLRATLPRTRQDQPETWDSPSDAQPGPLRRSPGLCLHLRGSLPVNRGFCSISAVADDGSLLFVPSFM